MGKNHFEKVGDCFVEHIAFEPPQRIVTNVAEIKFPSLGEEVVLESPEGDRVTLSLHPTTNSAESLWSFGKVDNLPTENKERTAIIRKPFQYVILETECYRPAPSFHEPEV